MFGAWVADAVVAQLAAMPVSTYVRSLLMHVAAVGDSQEGIRDNSKQEEPA